MSTRDVPTSRHQSGDFRKRPRYVPEPNWWWDKQREHAVERGEKDPGPLYRDTQYSRPAAATLFGGQT